MKIFLQNIYIILFNFQIFIKIILMNKYFKNLYNSQNLMEQTQPSDDKLQSLRNLMSKNGIDAYIVPHSDNHFSEYIAKSDERLEYISDFSGSSGFAYVTQNEALLWTDSRYYLQAKKQLKHPWEMMKQEAGHKLWHDQALSLKEGSLIGFDPSLMSAGILAQIQAKLLKQQIKLHSLELNLIDCLWTNKPEEPINEVIIHTEQWVDQPIQLKLDSLWKRIRVDSSQCDILLTAALDEIAYIINLRGSDISYNPVFKAYLLLNNFQGQQEQGTLYTNPLKINQEVRDYLNVNKIVIKDYKQIFQDLQTSKKNIYVNKNSVNFLLYNSIPSDQIVSCTKNPITYLKGVKGLKEQQGMRDCHIRDASALISYFAWLENELVNNHNKSITEYSGAQVLEGKRKALQHNMGLSFTTISSIGPNGAIIHYKPDKDTAMPLTPDQVYLVDSGGQYLDGTTDVTRTVHFGTPSQEEKDSFTRVFLGNQDVQRLTWPTKHKVTGADVDILARKHLWEGGLDYGHGTGHGVGHFLNVHEGPHGIGRFYDIPFTPGMVVTDEPGYYKEGGYGIRIEDCLLVVEKQNGFYGFENLTQVPYDRNLMNFSLLSKAHVEYINQYHQSVYEKVSPLLQGDQLALDFIQKHTAKIEI